MSALFAVVMVTAFFAGVALVPLTVWFFAPSFPHSAKRLMGKVLFTMMMFSFGRAVVRERDSGQYEFWVGHGDENGDLVATRGDETVPIQYRNEWYRLGKRPIAFTSEKGHDQTRRFVSGDLVDRAEGAIPDGGKYDVVDQRQGYPIVFDRSLSPNALIADMRKVWDIVGNAAGAKHVEDGERQALKEEGGDREVSTVALGILSIVAAVAGAAMSYLALVGV